VPEAQFAACTVTGTTDVLRFPKRPRIRLRFFTPSGGGLREGEEPAAFAARLLAECREGAPPVNAGRRPPPTG
jgi:1-acyl-sn-glycerol-3-phosphate acyltransferase